MVVDRVALVGEYLGWMVSCHQDVDLVSCQDQVLGLGLVTFLVQAEDVQRLEMQAQTEAALVEAVGTGW